MSMLVYPRACASACVRYRSGENRTAMCRDLHLYVCFCDCKIIIIIIIIIIKHSNLFRLFFKFLKTGGIFPTYVYILIVVRSV